MPSVYVIYVFYKILTLIRLGFFDYAITGGGGGGGISAIIRAIATKFCTRVAPDIIYMTA